MNIREALIAVSTPGLKVQVEANTQFKPVTRDELVRDLTAASKQYTQYCELLENATSEEVKLQHMKSKVYWKAIMNILKAAILTGAESLPKISFPEFEGLDQYDRMAEIEKFGFKVLHAAESKGGVNA